MQSMGPRTPASKTSILAIMDENRKRLGFGRDNTFVATPNVRNPAMMVEAEAFSHHLDKFERAVREYHKRVQGCVRGLLPLLDSNLPRVWLSVDEASGLAEPLRPSISHGHPSRVGGEYDMDAMNRYLDRLDRGIQEDVLLPLRRWQEGLAVAKERMRSLEKLRKEVDGHRRKAEKKFSRSEGKLRKAYLGAGYGSSSSSSSSDGDDVVPRGRLLEDYHRLALHTERQLRALLESYEDQERLVWEQLSGLVTDAAWLESYAAAAMLKFKEAFQGLALALGPSKQPLPAYRGGPYHAAAASTSVGRYGEIGEHTGLIAQMSPRAVQLARGGAPRAAKVLPYTPLKAKRGTATPLLVAAAAPPGQAQRAMAREDVPEVEVGASGLPLHALPAPVRHKAFREVEAAMSVPGSVPGAPSAATGSRVSATTISRPAALTSTTDTTTHGLAPRAATAATVMSPMSTAAAHAAPVTPSGAASLPRAAAAVASPAFGGGKPREAEAREAAPALRLQEEHRPSEDSFPASHAHEHEREEHGERDEAEYEGVRDQERPAAKVAVLKGFAEQDRHEEAVAAEAGPVLGGGRMPTDVAGSSPDGSRPTTPGSSITDAIRAEISRSTPRHSMSADASAAAANAPHTGSAGTHLKPAAGRMSPLGDGADEDGDEFVDARSTAPSSRTSSMGFEPHRDQRSSDAAAAPWSPVSSAAGLSKQQQQQQLGGVHGLVR